MGDAAMALRILEVTAVYNVYLVCKHMHLLGKEGGREGKINITLFISIVFPLLHHAALIIVSVRRFMF
jgi:hypothetical protein